MKERERRRGESYGIYKRTCELDKVKFPELPVKKETWGNKKGDVQHTLWGTVVVMGILLLS